MHLTKGELQQLVTTGVVHVTSAADGEWGKLVRVEIDALSSVTVNKILDALIDDTEILDGREAKMELQPGSSLWLGYIYGNVDRIRWKGKLLASCTEDELRDALSHWMEKGLVPTREVI